MSRLAVLRATLWISAPANLGAALLFAFPASSLGALAGLPPAVPGLYRGLTAIFIGLFGLAYAWLAAQREPRQPLLWAGAIGKAAFFLLALLLWMAGATDGGVAVLASGDLLLAALWFWALSEAR